MEISDHDRSADHTSFTTLAVPAGFQILTVGHFKFIFLLENIDYTLVNNLLWKNDTFDLVGSALYLRING